ncbi:hypothetical protein [Chamaesiphon sp. VAR_48_metabat_403]|uniref:hypothetical protein n=1 Tax=Chamaesiphon sp. VAR_48_metabat_403 TaxID=2964700 RepID=UPI00286E74D0|nr:hypothetical protein [Chamaesiphon sp. VAR_48_metabat_403]
MQWDCATVFWLGYVYIARAGEHPSFVLGDIARYCRFSARSEAQSAKMSMGDI